ncbi:MAG: hypothetical protein Q9195_007330 [Heterodermia aff. obscurata]
MSTTPSPFGALSLLPPEIRTILYGLVFASGNTALARTSNALHADTWAALHRYGVYRLNIDPDCWDWRDPNPVFQKCPKDVQNVDIRITPPPDDLWHWYKSSKKLSRVSRAIVLGPLMVLDGLVDAIEKRRFCRVQFTMATDTDFFRDTLKDMTWLGDFERVDVELVSSRKEKSKMLGPCSAYQAVHIVKLELGGKEKEEGRPKVTVVYVDRDDDTGSYVCERAPLINWEPF